MENKQFAPPDRPEPTPQECPFQAGEQTGPIADGWWPCSCGAEHGEVAVPARAHHEETTEDEMQNDLARSGTTEIGDRQPAAVADAGSQKESAGTKEQR